MRPARGKLDRDQLEASWKEIIVWTQLDKNDIVRSSVLEGSIDEYVCYHRLTKINNIDGMASRYSSFSISIET